MNKEILYGIGGLIVGLVIMLVVQSANEPRKMEMHQEQGEHMMHDKMMNGDESMHDMMSMMSASLEGKTGDEFDKAFLAEMIIHHQGAVNMAEKALENAGHQELKDLSQAIISAQNSEIEQMKKWQTEWFK